MIIGRWLTIGAGIAALAMAGALYWLWGVKVEADKEIGRLESSIITLNADVEEWERSYRQMETAYQRSAAAAAEVGREAERRVVVVDRVVRDARNDEDDGPASDYLRRHFERLREIHAGAGGDANRVPPAAD